jgi:hypothetical protein
MCMAPAHHWGGFVAGAALAVYAHQPLWVAVPSAAVASLTAGGRFSPDADQYKAWRLFDKYTPDESSAGAARCSIAASLTGG